MATKKKTLKKPTKATAQPQTVQPQMVQPKQAPADAQTPQPDPSALSIGDLKNLSTTLDIASTRGAFKAAEMATVGFLYNKLQAFLAKVAPPEPKKETEPTTTKTKTEPTTTKTGTGGK